MAILTAIFSGPQLGKGNAQAASCMANVRSCNWAWQMYAQDNRDRLVLNAWTNSPGRGLGGPGSNPQVTNTAPFRAC